MALKIFRILFYVLCAAFAYYFSIKSIINPKREVSRSKKYQNALELYKDKDEKEKAKQKYQKAEFIAGLATFIITTMALILVAIVLLKKSV